MSREPFLRLLDNPIGSAHARRRLRRRHALPGLLAIGAGALVALLWAGVRGSGPESWGILRDLFLATLAGLICLRGTAQVSAAVGADRWSGRLDLYRTTPTSAWTDALGYVGGCAAREYVGASILVPCFLLAAVQSGTSMGEALVALYLVVASGLLCQVYGTFIGLVWPGERAAVFATSSLLALFALTAFDSSVRFAAFTHVSPLPALRSLGYFVEAGTSADGLSFLGVPCTHVTFTLVLQGGVLAFLAWITARKLRMERAPALTRAGALSLFVLLSLFLLAPSWGRLGSLDWLASSIGTQLALGVLLAGGLAFALVPSYTEALSTIRRTGRSGRPVPWSDQGASSWPLVPCFVISIGASVVLVLKRAEADGLVDGGVAMSADVVRAVLGCGLFLGLLFGVLECSRMVPATSPLRRLSLVAALALALPWVMGSTAATLFSSPVLSGFLHASSPLFCALGPVDSLVRRLSSRPQIYTEGQILWSLVLSTALALSLWRGALRQRARMTAEEAGAGALPSIEAFRDAS